MNKIFLNKQAEIPSPQILDQDPGEAEGRSPGGNHWNSKPKSVSGTPRRSRAIAAAAPRTASRAPGLGLHFRVSTQEVLGLSMAHNPYQMGQQTFTEILPVHF